MLLEEWRDMEKSFDELGDVSIVQKKMPRRVKRKRAVFNEDGSSAGYGLHAFNLSLVLPISPSYFI